MSGTPFQSVTIDVGRAELAGDLSVPENANGLVIFAHGSGSSRFSSRNRFVAEQLNRAGLATLLFDLLTSDEDVIDQRTRELRFDISLLAQRLTATVDWAGTNAQVEELPIGLFGASTGAAAALITAAERSGNVRAVVSRGGRPDLAGNALVHVEAPTLLIVGSRDETVIELNQRASAQMKAERKIEIVEGATHLFEEPGTLESVARLAADWFAHTLTEPAR